VIGGSGPVILFDHTGDNALVGLRFRLKGVKMLAAEAPFEAGGKHYGAGSFILPNAPRAQVEKVAAQLGVSGAAVAAMPQVATHPLTAPRIGYMHSWLYTQDEGWWRAALDYYGVPYTYFADTQARRGDLRKKFDVLIYPTVGSTARDQIVGVTGNAPIPYRKSALTPHLGVLDASDDIRGGLGADGVAQLKSFVDAGGVLIGDGSTVEALADYGVAQGVTVSKPAGLFTKGAIMRGVFTDKTSPLAYGYDGKEMPVYFGADPVLSVGAGSRGNAYFNPNAPGAGVSQNTTPNAVPQALSPWAEAPAAPASSPMDLAPPAASPAGTPEPAAPVDKDAKFKGPPPRVVMQFPDKADDILLSGLLTGGGALTKKALVVDVP
jgi:hypothetical protein